MHPLARPNIVWTGWGWLSRLLAMFAIGTFLPIITGWSEAKKQNSSCPEALELLSLSNKIDGNGAFRGSINFTMNERVLELAGCFARTGDQIAAEAVARILMRYADVVRRWPLLDENGSTQTVSDFTYWRLGGFWGGDWIYDDLSKSANLAHAFNLIADSPVLDQISQQLSVDVRATIREKLLRYLVDFNLRFGRGALVGSNIREATFPFSNMDPSRLKSLIVFGKAVDPSYIHIAVRFLRLYPTVGFFRDGFWHEGTFSYHKQVVEALDEVIAELKGYSDPTGYSHLTYTTLFGDLYRGEPGRFDKLDPEGPAAAAFARMRRVAGALRFPNGRMLVRNDSHYAESGRGLVSPNQSRCLFGLRHCVLVSGKAGWVTIVHLSLGGTEGHEHLSALNLELWSLDRLLLGGGAYKGYSSREWNASTAAHNTVVINSRNQDSRWDDREPLTALDLIPDVGNYLWQGYGEGDSENSGDLLAADLSGSPVQYVATDATRAYNAQTGATEYGRTLLLMGEPKDRVYLLDVFKVTGGDLHEWMLHGDLAEDAEVQTSLQELPANAKLGSYLRVARSAKTSGLWTSDIIYKDGTRLHTFHLGASSSEVAIARGPAQMRRGEANYIRVARTGPSNVFVALHVPQGVGTMSTVKNIELLSQSKSELRLQILLANGRVDNVTLREPTAGLARLTHIATVPDGRCQWRFEGDIATRTREWRGRVVGVERKDHGDKTDGIRVSDWPASMPAPMPALLHIQPDGKHAVLSFGIRTITPQADGGAFIEVDGDPGFEIHGEGENSILKLLYYPSRGFQGPARYRTTTNDFRHC